MTTELARASERQFKMLRAECDAPAREPALVKVLAMIDRSPADPTPVFKVMRAAMIATFDQAATAVRLT
jgi:hypothetical protein